MPTTTTTHPVQVDHTDLVTILTTLADRHAAAHLPVHVVRSAIRLEAALGEQAPTYGVFGIDWALRSSDQDGK